jgi:putative spermidine/putrescine transport system ATP-binding protein
VTRETFIRLSEVRLEGVGKRWSDAFAVKDVSLSIRPGDFYTVLGPPRCGKTTLLKMLAGLIVLDAGRIVIDDQVVDRTPPSERNVGMVFQQNSLWPHLSIFENVAFGLRTRGESANQVAGKVKAALAQVELAGIEGQRPADLPRSQQQRVALARMLVMQPRLLLLDEPLSELDAGPRAEMRLWLSAFHRDVGITTIHASHDPAEALALSTRVAVISDGRVIQEGKPHDVYWHPRNRFVAEFVGAANLVPVRVVELREMGVVVETPGGAQVPVASGGHAWWVGARGLLCLRPEALVLEESALARSGIPGTVSAYVFEGSRQLYQIDIGGGALYVEMVTSALLGGGWKLGDRVKVEVSSETAVLMPEEGPQTR